MKRFGGQAFGRVGDTGFEPVSATTTSGITLGNSPSDGAAKAGAVGSDSAASGAVAPEALAAFVASLTVEQRTALAKLLGTG